MSQTKRSLLAIDAGAQAAATGAMPAVTPLKKPGIAASLVLRLFRSKVSGPVRKNQVTTEVKPVYDRCVVKPRRKAAPASARVKGGNDHGQG